MRKLAVALALTMAALMAVVFAGTAAAQTGGGCHLQGSASFSPGLNSSSKPFNYSFAGQLSSCQSNQAGAPATGTVEAGKVWTDATGQQFQEPISSGQGGCTNSTTSGTGIVKWADGTLTIVDYTTTGAAAAVHLDGTVIPSVTLPAINPQPGQPTSTTLTTTRFAGASALGALTFQPPDPTACNTPAGVTTAAIDGVISLGSS
jgi:hypothetical protein